MATGSERGVPFRTGPRIRVTAGLAVDGDPVQSDGNDDTGKWGLSGLLGLFGLFGYRKYRDARTGSTHTTSARTSA